ncbi:MAG: 2-C-methyl-D-erythritol 4-phosphate cytidylyltransferase [Lachnospiraceae bacterium]|nr:2-C-methyl-D-erythritol 4-phosphate cytidylyltransferase [Lachnospiraceae bacterium]
MNRKRNALVLLAGGRGTRMGTGVHKQFLELGGKPLIWHSLNAVQKSDLIDDVILVSGEDDMAQIRELVSRYGFDKVSMIVKGGEERYLSVVSGVKAIFERGKECEAFSGTPEIILVHDGARPFIDDGIIGRCLEGVEETGGCVAAVPSKDTVKLADENAIVESEPPRDRVWNMQTPQVFRSQILYEACKKASEADRDAGITDDARMVSMFTDTKIKLVMGSYENIKITTPVDVLIAGKILEDKIGHIS